MDTFFSRKIELDIQRMLEDSEFAAEVEHGPGRGSARENALRAVFQEYLPEEYKISQKVYIIDSSGAVSPECDLVIHQKYGLKSLVKNGNEFIPIECVRYVIEVKSTSTKVEVSKSIAAAQKLQTLKPNPEIANNGLPVCCYFSYRSDLKTEHSEFRRYIEAAGGFFAAPPISVLCDVDRGYYYFGNRYHQSFGIINYSWSAINSDRISNVKMFVVGVLNTLNRTQPFGYYAAEPGSIKFVYYRDLVDDYEITFEKHLEFLELQIALDEERIEDYISLAEKHFISEMSDRLLLSAYKMFFNERNLISADILKRYLVSKVDVYLLILKQLR